MLYIVWIDYMLMLTILVVYTQLTYVNVFSPIWLWHWNASMATRISAKELASLLPFVSKLVDMTRGLSSFLMIRAYLRWREALFGGVFGYRESKLTWSEKLCVYAIFWVCYDLSSPTRRLGCLLRCVVFLECQKEQVILTFGEKNFGILFLTLQVRKLYPSIVLHVGKN